MITYLLKVISWENDADNYNTVEIRSQDRTEIEFYIKVAQLFISCNNWNGNKGFGNADRPVDGVEAAIDKIVAEHTGTIPKYWDKERSKRDDPDWWAAGYGDNGDYYEDGIYDLIGLWCEGERYRVFESFKVFKVTDIEDVTGEF